MLTVPTILPPTYKFPTIPAPPETWKEPVIVLLESDSLLITKVSEAAIWTESPALSKVKFPLFVEIVFVSTTTFPRVEIPSTVMLSNCPVPKSNVSMVPIPVILRLVAWIVCPTV